MVTGVFLACYNIGSAVGDAIAGAIWTQVLPGQLSKHLGDDALVQSAYGDPITFAGSYSIGTPEREGVVEAYKHVQRLLCITGICLTVPLIFFAFCMRDPKLTKDQSLSDAEKSDSDSSSMTR